MSAPMGPDPCTAICTACNKQVTTNVTYIASTKTHLIALLLCCFGCCPCAACLYCTKCCRNVEHRCPTCDSFLGVYER